MIQSVITRHTNCVNHELPKLKKQGTSLKGMVGILTSGGIDSSILLAEASLSQAEVTPLFVRGGLFWEEAELFWLKRFIHALHASNIRSLIELEVPSGRLYGRTHWSVNGEDSPGQQSADPEVYLPGRNLLTLAFAGTYAALHHIDEIWLGILKGNPFSDATEPFLKNMEMVIHQAMSKNVAIKAPYHDLSKVEVLKKGVHLPLELTFSCLSPIKNDPCGKCNKCAERKRSFREANIDDRTEYRT